MMAFTGRRAADVVRVVAHELGLTSDQVRAIGQRVQRGADGTGEPIRAAWVDDDSQTVIGLLLPLLRSVWLDRGTGNVAAHWRDWYVNVTQQAAQDADRRDRSAG